jgi:large subunit ribosomal protein L15
MARRHARKWKKYLGSRNWGAGNTKNRRGTGSRGGRGYAGSGKHRWTWILRYEPDHFGKSGFARPTAKAKLDFVSVDQIAQWAKSGKFEKKAGMASFTFEGKVLGTGRIDVPVNVRAVAFSSSAKEKIEAAGGKTESTATKVAKVAEGK